MSFVSQLQKQKNKLKETDTVITKIDGQRYVENKREEKIKSLEPSHGFVVDTKPDKKPAEIVPHFYIGSQDCTADDILKEYNIQHVLSLGVNMCLTVDNMYVDCLDLPETDIKNILIISLPYIHKAVKNKENVLVHCNAGVSRTSTVAIGYLMHYNNMNFVEAFDLVKLKRPAVRPNDGFRRQLLELQPGCLLNANNSRNYDR